MSKTTHSGGVFVLVSDTVVCSEQPQLKSDCKIIWVKLEIEGSQPLYIEAYYKPKEDTQNSLDMLIDFELKKVLLPPPREFCRHILS